jgi:competence protein ComEA
MSLPPRLPTDDRSDELLHRLGVRPLPASHSPDGVARLAHGRRRRRAAPSTVAGRARERLDIVAARTGVTPRAVVGLLVLGAAIACVLLVRLLLVQHDARPVALRMTGAVSAAPSRAPAPDAVPPSPDAVQPSPGATTTSAPTQVGSGAAPSGTVLVHVVGQVRHPGVVRLPEGARVEQALEAAGGATSKADLVRVNLARPVVDGEQIVVPKPGQPIDGAPASPGSGAATGRTAGGQVAVVDLNTADLSALDSLPGVGPVLAQRILDWRTANGRFSSVDELGEVSGIGDKVLEKLRPLVRV